MNHDFTIAELDILHLAVITRERVIREKWLQTARDAAEKDSMIAEADALDVLSKKVCAAKLTKELGFYVEPIL